MVRSLTDHGEARKMANLFIKSSNWNKINNQQSTPKTDFRYCAIFGWDALICTFNVSRDFHSALHQKQWNPFWLERSSTFKFMDCGIYRGRSTGDTIRWPHEVPVKGLKIHRFRGDIKVIICGDGKIGRGTNSGVNPQNLWFCCESRAGPLMVDSFRVWMEFIFWRFDGGSTFWSIIEMENNSNFEFKKIS